MRPAKKKKYAITLLEIMIVILLIGLIGSVVGYNMKGSLDEGKAFRSEKGKEQIRDILLLEVAKGNTIEEVVAHKEQFLKNSGLVKDVSKLLSDGWGQPYEVKAIRNNTDISVTSDKLVAYRKSKNPKHIERDPEDNAEE